MAIDNTVELLLRLPLFGGLQPLQLAEIVRRAERVRFWPGDVLTKAGQPGDGAYLIVSGPAQRVAGPGIAAMAMPEIVVPGSLIGEMAMLVEHDYALDHRCARSCVLPQAHRARKCTRRCGRTPRSPSISGTA